MAPAEHIGPAGFGCLGGEARERMFERDACEPAGGWFTPRVRDRPAQVPKSGQSWRSQDRSPLREAAVIVGTG